MSILDNNIDLPKIAFKDLWMAEVITEPRPGSGNCNKLIAALFEFFERDPGTWDRFIRLFSMSWYYDKSYICTQHEEKCHMLMLKIATFIASWTGNEITNIQPAYYRNPDGTIRPSIHMVSRSSQMRAHADNRHTGEYWFVVKLRSETGITVDSVLGTRRDFFGRIPMKEKNWFNLNPKTYGSINW